MSDAPSAPAETTAGPLSRKPGTAVLVLADGTVFEGHGFGAATSAVGEVCFNTAMTGYQEIMTDPSYAGQIVAFTFPHVGIVGTNQEDFETTTPVTRAMVVRADAEEPSNYRNMEALGRWLELQNIPGIAGIDTRALTASIRKQGMPHGVVAHDPNGKFDIDALVKQARDFSGLVGMDMAAEVTCRQMYRWTETPWRWDEGFGEQTNPTWRAVVLDYGVKRNILRELAGLGAEVIVLPASASFEDVMCYKPDGVMLSNGPGDPAATGEYAIPTIKKLIDSDVPIFGICLGHQILSLALGAKTHHMAQGHHGANHPVKDLETGKVEIVSMNHGFTVDRDSLPKGVVETHVSLFDKTNCGLRVEGKKIFSVQYHPEASPGPQDSHYLFERFAKAALG
jgi:carbamoyl-phosphate synthase small subunit